MKSFKKIISLGAKFENKYGQYEQSQKGTTELFFDSPEKQQKFSQIVQSPDGLVAKTLMNFATKTNQAASFSLKISAEPSKGATWIFSVVPASLTATVKSLVNQEFKKFMSQDMNERLVAANAGAKAGSGSGGPLNVASLDVDA
jgi:hypothetical protein